MKRVIFIFLMLLAGNLARAQSGDPRVTAALAEMQTLGDAEQEAAIDTDFYVSLETLNDIPAPSTPQTPYDNLNNEGGTWVIRPTVGLFNTNRVNLETAFNAWQGPYVNYQQGETQTATTPYDQGSPLDPWGNPFYFLMPAGLVRGDEGVITLELYGDAFDQPTIVSLGPDGVMSGDDLFYQFGGGVGTFEVTSVNAVAGKSAGVTSPIEKMMPPGTTLSGGVFTVSAGSTLIVRGLNFGATQSGAQVKWGSTGLSNTGWSDRQTTVTLPGNLSGNAALTVTRGASVSLPATLVIKSIVNGVRDWAVYQ